MRQPKTDIPGLVLSTRGKSRIAYMPADLDRRYTREHLPDHGDLLANIVRWAAGDDIPLAVEGPGLIDCHLYTQGNRLILHLVNLTSAGTWRAPVEELIPGRPSEGDGAFAGDAGRTTGAPARLQCDAADRAEPRQGNSRDRLHSRSRSHRHRVSRVLRKRRSQLFSKIDTVFSDTYSRIARSPKSPCYSPDEKSCSVAEKQPFRGRVSDLKFSRYCDWIHTLVQRS